MAEQLVNEEIVANMEKRLDDLRLQFEQYFMGSRKRVPEQEKTSLQFQLRKLSNQNIPNTKLRFRFQQLVSKFNSYNQYWMRNLQKIEAGTYKRPKPEISSGTVDKVPGQKPPSQKKGPSKGGEAEVDKLHKELMEARRQLNQSTNVSKEKLEQTIKKQKPALQEKHKGKKVEFKVVVEDGKAKVKATLK